MAMIKRINSLLLLIASLTLLPSCGGRDDYKLDVTVEGLGTQSVSLYFYTRDGLRTISIPVVDGHLEYTSSSQNPVLIELRVG